MRTTIFFFLAAFLTVSPAIADPFGVEKPIRSTEQGKTLPLKATTSGNPCAAYGPGFIKPEGTDTCVKIGGGIRVEVGGSAR